MTAAIGKFNLTHSAGAVASCFKSSWQRWAAPAVLGTLPTMAEVGSEKRCVCLAQSYDAMPEVAQQRSEGMHSRSCWYLGMCQRDHFPKVACSIEGCITSKKAWMAKAVSQSWDPFVPWKRKSS